MKTRYFLIPLAIVLILAGVWFLFFRIPNHSVTKSETAEPAPAATHPKANDVQPDRLPFGTVYAGAIVEGSFLLLETGTDTNIPFSVSAPTFVKVSRTATYHQEFGSGKDFICGTVEFAVDTSTSGNLTGEFNVKLGNAAAKIPISATVKPARNGLPRLLIVETPFACYSTGNGEEFKTWTELAKGASLDVNYLLVTSGKPVLRDLELGKFDCVLLASTGLTELQPADTKRVREFAEAGGRVIVSANAFFGGTVEKANEVVDGYGIQMRNAEARLGQGDDVTLGKIDLDPELVTAGVRSARFFRASPIAMTADKGGRVLVKASGVGEPGDGFVASARAGKGVVVVLGESLWWNWITEKEAKGTDNARLLRFLLISPRQK
jgi:hypothetical protein